MRMRQIFARFSVSLRSNESLLSYLDFLFLQSLALPNGTLAVGRDALSLVLPRRRLLRARCARKAKCAWQSSWMLCDNWSMEEWHSHRRRFTTRPKARKTGLQTKKESFAPDVRAQGQTEIKLSELRPC